jgi:hypothetical protein
MVIAIIGPINRMKHSFDFLRSAIAPPVTATGWFTPHSYVQAIPAGSCIQKSHPGI